MLRLRVVWIDGTTHGQEPVLTIAVLRLMRFYRWSKPETGKMDRIIK